MLWLLRWQLLARLRAGNANCNTHHRYSNNYIILAASAHLLSQRLVEDAEEVRDGAYEDAKKGRTQMADEHAE